jgi:hypothetical protein
MEREWWMGKTMDYFERKFAELIYDLIDSRDPLYIMWIEQILF